jgi:hypothetical protein
MKKLGREIRVKFIYTDELLKKLFQDRYEESWYQKMKEEFAVKEIIKFNPFYGDSYEKELLTFSHTFTFFSYKDIAETLKDYKDFVILEYRISDNNKDYFKSKEYGHVWACDVIGLNMKKCLEKYIDLEKRNYDIVNTKAGAKYSIKKVYYYGNKI